MLRCNVMNHVDDNLSPHVYHNTKALMTEVVIDVCPSRYSSNSLTTLSKMSELLLLRDTPPLSTHSIKPSEVPLFL